MKTEELSTAQNSRRYQRWLMVLLTGSVLLNVVLSYKTFQLYGRVKFLSAVIQQTNVKNQAQVGAWVPPLEHAVFFFNVVSRVAVGVVVVNLRVIRKF